MQAHSSQRAPPSGPVVKDATLRAFGGYVDARGGAREYANSRTRAVLALLPEQPAACFGVVFALCAVRLFISRVSAGGNRFSSFFVQAQTGLSLLSPNVAYLE